ncbi:lipopolysaccharide biosynthesis protein [Maricaulis sp.]|uniref:lipopolysaccharide biosynthesis protein n=1 Tax=Maricaulis sp. TaxID=1486257 RepID=UPI002B26ED06|nr:oligosaccharide flippase family protein [Maricaulis sp.]
MSDPETKPVSTAITPPPTRLMSGMVWNLGSLVFLAAAGVVMNIIIARVYDETVLGLFNICFALYIALSQFGVFGFHLSALQSVSEFAHDDQDRAISGAFHAVVVVAISTTVATLAGLLLTPVLAQVYQIDGFVTAWLVMLPGLWGFAVNKVLYAVINGARQMRVFAVMQSLRYIFMIAALVVLALTDAPGAYITLSLTVAELALLPVLAVAAIRAVGLKRMNLDRVWIRRHLSFGARVFLSGAILELNSRVSVLVLGYMVGAAQTGIYTMAVLIQEGVMQAIFVVRNNINPLIARHIRDGERERILKLSRLIFMAGAPVFLIAAGFGWLLYPFFVDWFLGDPIYYVARTPLFVLLAMMGVAAPFLMFNQTFSQAHKPSVHTGYMATVLLANCVLNIALIPGMGLLGAALSTGGSFVVSSIMLVVLARRVLGVRIVF